METKESATAVVIPAGRRVLIGLLWGLIQAATVFVLLFAGGVAAGPASRLRAGLDGPGRRCFLRIHRADAKAARPFCSAA